MDKSANAFDNVKKASVASGMDVPTIQTDGAMAQPAETAAQPAEASPQASSTSSKKPRSYKVAGWLAIFLGQFGVHHMYLGNTGLALAHLGLFAAALLVDYLMYWLFAILILGNFIWSIVEGVDLLTKKVDDDAAKAESDAQSDENASASEEDSRKTAGPLLTALITLFIWACGVGYYVVEGWFTDYSDYPAGRSISIILGTFAYVMPVGIVALVGNVIGFRNRKNAKFYWASTILSVIGIILGIAATIAPIVVFSVLSLIATTQ